MHQVGDNCPSKDVLCLYMKQLTLVWDGCVYIVHLIVQYCAGDGQCGAPRENLHSALSGWLPSFSQLGCQVFLWCSWRLLHCGVLPRRRHCETTKGQAGHSHPGRLHGTGGSEKKLTVSPSLSASVCVSPSLSLCLSLSLCACAFFFLNNFFASNSDVLFYLVQLKC